VRRRKNNAGKRAVRCSTFKDLYKLKERVKKYIERRKTEHPIAYNLIKIDKLG
jgi:hypothetical protein